MPKAKLEFDQGRLVVQNFRPENRENYSFLEPVPHSFDLECSALYYRALIRNLVLEKIPFENRIANYEDLSVSFFSDFSLLSYQKEAIQAWMKKKWGIVMLPTGAGKSILACSVIGEVKKSAIILVPTIDLLTQWKKVLEKHLRVKIGILGGGKHEIENITVSTYDSARIHAEKIGNRFCLIVFDECHHLPSPGYEEMAIRFIAPYRLGLSATPFDAFEKEQILKRLCGDLVYQKEVDELSGDFLAPYRIQTLYIPLTNEERERYEVYRNLYMDFRRKVMSSMRGIPSWEEFTMTAYRTAEGRNAMKHFYAQKKIVTAAEGKIQKIGELIVRHRNSRILIFTNDNPTAYAISALFLFPLIVHETKSAERKKTLENFRNGNWPFLVSSRVLNEGVDVPEADVAIMVSGTSVGREYTQRLGRILRKKDGKQAILYELIAEDTWEVRTGQKRREDSGFVFSRF